MRFGVTFNYAQAKESEPTTVGMDVAGDKLMEVHVLGAGGVNSARMFEKVDFAGGIVDALERKVNCMRSCGRNFSNIDLATL